MSIKVVSDTTVAGVRTIVALKSVERYHWRFRVDRTAELMGHLGTQAANPELSFTWNDAAVLGTYLQTVIPQGTQ